MFRSRRSSAKPGDDLLANFRRQFPEVVSAPGANGSYTLAVPKPPVPVTINESRTNQSLIHDAFKDQDSTPRANNEQWRFTPSLLDSNSFSFPNVGNQNQGYYPLTPGGTNTIYHPQAGDLHAPALGLAAGIGLNNPNSLGNSEAVIHQNPSNVIDMSSLSTFNPSQFHLNALEPLPVSQQSFVHQAIVQQDASHEAMAQDGSPMDSEPGEERIASIDSTFRAPEGFQSSAPSVPIAGNAPSSTEIFRFAAALNAPTAMVKSAEEIPITYLNKGQAYSLSIVDTAAAGPIFPGIRYRTYVRVSFEDDQQRQKPGVCWGLWKEGRGTNEAHYRGGKLQAVEFVEAGQSIEGDEKRTRIELESCSFDGFSVVWSPGLNGAAECNIAVRFNFLSTDFSHSKGVKGIPVRLCAKTDPMSGSRPQAGKDSETCYCKVKLFRDHGAERKLANDVAHVKKAIDKVKQQIAQVESGMKDLGNRKRGATGVNGDRPGKVQKHRRTWSVSSTSSGAGVRSPAEDDLHVRLQSLQAMFTSTRPVSVLYLRGDDLDDPDAYPVLMPGEEVDKSRVDRDNPAWQIRSRPSSTADSSMVSPSLSSLSLHSQVSIAGQTRGDNPSHQGLSDHPIKIDKLDESGNLSGWIEALGVDPSYKPPPEPSVRPVACFYVVRKDVMATRNCHKAVYLFKRSAKEFTNRVALKWHLDPSKVTRTIHVLPRGLEVEMDEDVIQALPEGQDMILQIKEVSPTSPKPKSEWDMVFDVSPDNSASNAATPVSYELRLFY